MSFRLGQSSIEYLVTYGWMLLAVSMVGTVVYNQVQVPCDIRVTGGYGSKIDVSQAAVTGNDKLSLVFESGTYEELDVNQIQIQAGNEESYFYNETFQIRPGADKAVSVANAERKSGCTDVQMTVNFDEGPLENQQRVFDIKAPVNILGEIIFQLKISGGQINALHVDSSIQPSNTTSCFGNNCNTTEGPETSEYVSRSGDEMTGTLQTSELTAECIGNLCAMETGALQGNVSNQDNTMDGTLNTTEIKPSNNLCIGETC